MGLKSAWGTWAAEQHTLIRWGSGQWESVVRTDCWCSDGSIDTSSGREIAGIKDSLAWGMDTSSLSAFREVGVVELGVPGCCRRMETGRIPCQLKSIRMAGTPRLIMLTLTFTTTTTTLTYPVSSLAAHSPNTSCYNIIQRYSLFPNLAYPIWRTSPPGLVFPRIRPFDYRRPLASHQRLKSLYSSIIHLRNACIHCQICPWISVGMVGDSFQFVVFFLKMSIAL